MSRSGAFAIPSDPAAQMKGSAYLSTLRFIDERFGSEARARVLGRLSDSDRSFVSGLILPIGWYPVDPFPRLLRALDDELGKSDLALVEERGAWTATQDLKTTHRILLKLVTPTWVVEKGTSLWKTFHNSGDWEAQAEGKKGATARMRNFAVVDSAMCATVSGWMRGLLTMAGCRQIAVQHPACRTRGGAVCEWRVSWA